MDLQRRMTRLISHGYMKSAYLDVCVQLLRRDSKLIMEVELKEIVENRGGHMVQLDEAL